MMYAGGRRWFSSFVSVLSFLAPSSSPSLPRPLFDSPLRLLSSSPLFVSSLCLLSLSPLFVSSLRLLSSSPLFVFSLRLLSSSSLLVFSLRLLSSSPSTDLPLPVYGQLAMAAPGQCSGSDSEANCLPSTHSDVASPNSTANLFHGETQRWWMTGAPQPPTAPIRTCKHQFHNPDGPARVPLHRRLHRLEWVQRLTGLLLRA
ncbi:hypothetical protein BJ546DRAFT_358638 [Cryomyces antarcticus]